MVKVLHCADIHLDASFVCGSASKSEMRRNELLSSFLKMMNYIKMNGIDLVLVSGDLFDGENVTRDTLAIIQREFADNKDCRFVIAPGNHDPFTQNGVYAKIEFPSNVYIFSRPTLDCFSFDDINVDVYGYAFTSKELEYNPFKAIKPKSNSKINLLCAHGEIISSGIGSSCPITLNDIRESGFDYIALGHIHLGHDTPEKLNDTFYAYSGCLEGRDFGECGKKGVFYCEFEKDRCELTKAEFKKLYFSKRRYETEKINVFGAKNMSDVLNAVRERITEKGYTRDVLLRVVLEGEVSPELVVSQAAFASIEEQLFYLEIQNNTIPRVSIEALENDPTIRGAFYEKLKPMLMSDDENEKALAYSALKYGLSALSGNNVVDY